jgi:FkbM family methyltransferase
MRQQLSTLRTRFARSPDRPEPEPSHPEPLSREGVDNRNLELLLGFMLAEDSNCVDVGANEGRFLHHMRQRAPRGRHIAWEPVPHLAERLRDLFPDVEVHQAAVGDAPSEETSFVLVKDDPAYSGLRARAYPGDYQTEEIKVRVERLDEELPADYVPTLIKIDVEGGELGVLRGATETIVRHRPLVVFEHGPGASDRYGTTPEALHDLVCGDFGMRIFDMDASGPLSRDQLAELFRTGTRWNYLARV